MFWLTRPPYLRWAAAAAVVVFAFLIAPPATASLIVSRVPLMMIVAVAIGSVSAVIGLLISYHHGTATGATMALVTVVAFVAALAVQSTARFARR